MSDMTETPEELRLPKSMQDASGSSAVKLTTDDHAVIFTAHDRCDAKSCGAQAYVGVSLLNAKNPEASGGYLLFCGHHYAANEAALTKSNLVVSIHDERERLSITLGGSA